MLSSLPPNLKRKWEQADRLLDKGEEEEGMQITREVFQEMGFTEVVRMRREMGASD